MVLSLDTLIADEAVSRIGCGHYFASWAQAFRVEVLDQIQERDLERRAHIARVRFHSQREKGELGYEDEAQNRHPVSSLDIREEEYYQHYKRNYSHA
jgi:hypothetical protein